MSDNDARLALMKLWRGIFGTSNLIGTDFDDVRVFEVAGRNLPQQIDGNGLHVSFSISWHAMGKTGPEAYEGLRMLMPEHYPQPDDA